jgi:sugar phosphate isomerase/epimerase
MSDFGIVSNCWRTQLAAGVPLDALLAEAERLGYRHIELRQGCLGAYEAPGEGGAHPDADALRSLPDRFPRLAFNVAMALPYLGGEILPETPLFELGLRAALAVGRGSAHLRLVDPVTTPDAVTPEREGLLAERIAGLAARCREEGALLSIENARQPWGVLRRIFEGARERIGADRDELRLCYDPCNLLNAADRPDPAAVTAGLRAHEIALFHLKQAKSGEESPEVGPGEIDWPGQWGALQHMGYAGPRLFEIPPGGDIWERLERSRRFLVGLGPEE